MELHFRSARPCAKQVRPAYRMAVFIIALVTGITAIPTAFGQGELGGRLRGTISDPQGAALSGAVVTLKNPNTGLVKTASSNSSGDYVLVDVPAGTYTLTVSMGGFRSTTYNVTINLNEVRTLNAQLIVGSAQETVEVTGESSSVVSQETTLRNTVDEQRLEQLPLNGRDFSTLVMYTAGVQRSTRSNGQGSGFNVAGARATVNNFLIDGGDANDPDVPFGFATSGGLTSGLPIDAVAEFSVITSNAGAEFGRSSGGTVNVVTKTGTNHFHGTLWEYHRDKSLDARNYFDPVGTKSPFIQNQFGFQVTGPVFKNKTFFAGAYEGFREIQTVSTVVRVPTDAYIATVTNPLMKALLVGGFPRAPIGAVDPGGQFGNFTSQVNNGGNQNSYFTRVDHSLNQKNQLFFDYQFSSAAAQPGSQSGNIPGTGVGLAYKNWHAVANWNSTISNSLLNTARVVFQRNFLGFPTDAPPAALLDAGKLRTTGNFAGQPFSSDAGSPNGVPSFAFSDPFTNLGIANNFPQGRTSNTFQYEDTLAWTRGKHQFKFGGQISRIQENDNFGNDIRPAVNITDATTGAFSTQTQFTYLNNQPTKYFRQTEYGFFAQDTWKVEPRLTVDLGLRYELSTPLREKNNQISNVAMLDANNKPIPCKAIPLNGQLQNLAIVVPHQFGQDIYCTDKNNFAPRIGVAWDLFGTGKTVIRSSFGIFYDRIFTNALANARFSPPFTIPDTINAGGSIFDGRTGSKSLTPTAIISPTAIDPSLVTPYTERWNLTVAQELEKNTVLNISYVGARGMKLAENLNPNFGASFDVAFRPTNGSSTITRSAADIANNIIRGPFGNIGLRTSHAYSNYNGLDLSVNHRASAGLSFQANYTWSHSLDVISDEIVGGADSASPPATLNNLLAPLMTSRCPGANVAPPGNATTSAALTAAVQCATNSPNLTANQAAAIFVQNFISGVPLSTNYGDSAFDIRHRFTSTMVYALPFGTGKRWGASWRGPLNQAVGGWQISTTFEAQSGPTAPLTDGAAVDANRDGVTNDRPVLTGPLSAFFVSGNGGTQQAGTTVRGLVACSGKNSLSASCPSLDYGLGILDPGQRIGRGAVRGPGLWDLDFSADKDFKISERLGLQFRTEVFNLLNKVNFNRPTRTVSNPTTFGLITAQQAINGTQSRQIQFALKVIF